MAAEFVTQEEALRHLRLNGDEGSPDPTAEDVALKLEQAELIVIGHLKRVPSDSTEIAVMQAAILKVLGNLYRFRGDEENPQDILSPGVLAMLSMLRDPALA